MKIKFVRYWPIIPVSIILILIVAVLVHGFRETYWLAGVIYQFINDWSTVLSAAPTVLLVLGAVFLVFGAFLTIRESRRKQALGEIRNWATSMIMAVSVPMTQKYSGKIAKEMKNELPSLLVESFTMMDTAKKLGGKLKEKTFRAITLLDTVNNIIKGEEKNDAKLTDVLQELLGCLEDITDVASRP